MYKENEASIEAKIQEHQLELDRCATALTAIGTVEDAIANMADCEQHAASIRMGLDVVAQQVGFESHDALLGREYDAYNTEVSMESIRELPGKIYRAVSRLLRAVMDKLRQLWHMMFNRNNQKLEKAAGEISRFEEMVEGSEKAIKDYKLKVGAKLDEAELALLKENGVRVFLDRSGRLLDRHNVMGDISEVGDGTALKDPAYRQQLVYRGKWAGIPEAITMSREYLMLAQGGDFRSAYARLLEKMANMQSLEHFDWILNEGFKAVNDEGEIMRKEMRIEGSRQTARPLCGDIMPRMLSEKLGPIAMQNVTYGVAFDGPGKLPKGHPRLSYAQAKVLMDEAAKLASLSENLNNKASQMLTQFESYADGSGKNIAAAHERSKAFYNQRNKADMDKMERFYRSLPRQASISVGYLQEASKQARLYIDAISAYLTATIGYAVNDRVGMTAK